MGRRQLIISDSEKEEEEEEVQVVEEEEEEEEEEDEDDELMEDSEVEESKAKPIGKVRVITGGGKTKRNHYSSFECEGLIFELDQTVLITPEDQQQRPKVAIIRDISEDSEGNLFVMAQWFYRPKEAAKIGGEHWEVRDSRELFYSFRIDEVQANTMMHECVIHFVPMHKKLPVRADHPGFIVQKVYDIGHKKLLNLTDKGYDDNKQHEINLLVERTRLRIGELPDIVTEDSHEQKDDYLKSKKSPEKKIMHQSDVSGFDPTTRLDKLAKAYTPGNGKIEVSKYHAILSKFRVLTGDAHRDKWLEELLLGTQLICKSLSKEYEHKENALSSSCKSHDKSGVSKASVPHNNSSHADFKICWPDAAVPIVTKLERVTYEALGVDFLKYNQKMRQLDFNLKNSITLAERLLKGDLDPIALLPMSPEELKEGLASDQRIMEPEKTDQMRMTNTRCSRCTERQVAVTDIIQAGKQGDRYQLECNACGHTWYSSRDAVIL